MLNTLSTNVFYFNTKFDYIFRGFLLFLQFNRCIKSISNSGVHTTIISRRFCLAGDEMCNFIRCIFLARPRSSSLAAGTGVVYINIIIIIYLRILALHTRYNIIYYYYLTHVSQYHNIIIYMHRAVFTRNLKCEKKTERVRRGGGRGVGGCGRGRSVSIARQLIGFFFSKQKKNNIFFLVFSCRPVAVSPTHTRRPTYYIIYIHADITNHPSPIVFKPNWLGRISSYRGYNIIFYTIFFLPPSLSSLPPFKPGVSCVHCIPYV